MSSLVSGQPKPIYVFDSKYREGDLYAIHPENTHQNLERLNEFGVCPSRIHVLTDSSYLNKVLCQRANSILILGGGYTYFLSRELENVSAILKACFDQGRLNVWGQCSGGNILCSKVLIPPSRNGTRNFLDLNLLGLLPVTADTLVYPIEHSQTVGDLINRRISTLISSSNDIFTSFWYRGSQYRYDEDDCKCVRPLAFYNDVEVKQRASNKPVAAVTTTNRNGGCVVACGPHPEIVKVNIPRESSVEERLGSDKNRSKHLESIYREIGVLPKIVSKL